MPKFIRVAESLEVLRRQLNALYPTRSKVSDGGVGDLKHSKTKSEHNPNSLGIVRARDFTHDPATLKGQWLADALIASKDPRILYVIWNAQICRSYPAHGLKAWEWGKYSGRNAHKHHVHVSVVESQTLYDDDREWQLSAAHSDSNLPLDNTTTHTHPTASATPEPPTYTVKSGDTLTKIAQKFNLKLMDLVAINRRGNPQFDPDRLTVGQVLKLG